MKLRTLLLLLCFSLLLFSSTAEAQFLQGMGKIMLQSGKVTVLREGEKLTIGAMGRLLKTGDRIISDSLGKATLTLAGGTVFLAPSSQLDIRESFTQKGLAKIRHQNLRIRGKIRSKVRRHPARTFRVRTPNAIVGVKGTNFVVQYEKRVTTVGTIEGLVNMYSIVTQKDVNIASNEMSSVNIKGEIMPLSEFAGELMENVDFAGQKMEKDDFSGKPFQP